jgi:act minimal PKS acyl carrier protein
MTAKVFGLEDLKRILREGAGVSDVADLDGEILDTEFEQLGYESLALLETLGRIERELDITLDDSTLSESPTPRALIAAVTAHLA